MDFQDIIQSLLNELDAPAWVAMRVEVLPGVIDSKIIRVTAGMDRLYGCTWPDTLVGRFVSEIHVLSDTQITRQYALLRHGGIEAPRHYIMHGLHPNGFIFRVIKHVDQRTVGNRTVWITQHEKWNRSTSYPFLRLPSATRLQRLDVGAFLGRASVAEVRALVQLAVEAQVPLVSPQHGSLFYHNKIIDTPPQEKKTGGRPSVPSPQVGTLPHLTCKKCGESWTPRRVGTPAFCPRCKNPRWWEPRQRCRRKQQE
jgi:hypothetical protein